MLTDQVIKNIILTVIILSLYLIGLQQSYASAGLFYKGGNKYKGFYWFESNKNRSNDKIDKEVYYPTAEEANVAIAMRKKALDDARSQMVELAFIEGTPPRILREAIVKYKKLEAEMYKGAIRLTYANEMANFTNPDIANVTEYPTNVFANKIKRKFEEEQKTATIRKFAVNFDLLLFVSSDCPYSKAFEPVITNFAMTHGFSLEKADLNSTEGKVAQNMGIKYTPALVAVRKDAKEMFEISRGLSSVSELETSIILSTKYSSEQKKQYRIQKDKR